MSVAKKYCREEFINSNWSFNASPDEDCGYVSIMHSLQDFAKEKREASENECADIFDLLARAASMILTPDSINQPFAPFVEYFYKNLRSPIPDDFTVNELMFFKEILSDIKEPRLLARIADLLWLCKKPRNPDYAKIAIKAYTQLSTENHSWQSDTNNCWERAVRLALQIKDEKRIEEIKSMLFAAFNKNYPDNFFMPLSLAKLLDKLEIDKQYREYIAIKLFQLGCVLTNDGDFYGAREYFELSAKKCKQCGDNQGELDNLFEIAHSFETEAESRKPPSNLIANTLYNNAIQAYRRIPTKDRARFDIDNKLEALKTKITDTGKDSLDELSLFKTDSIDITELVSESVSYVTGKQSTKESLLNFVTLYRGPHLSSLTAEIKQNIEKNPLSLLGGYQKSSSDGRVIAKTTQANLNANIEDSTNQEVFDRLLHEHFALNIQLIVEAQLHPALEQILLEHRITLNILEEICYLSPIVPLERKKLLSFALWLGFEYQFGHAIHLLCPQLEHIVRTKLKEFGVSTTNIDRNGIEEENGLSTLMNLEETVKIFGGDLTFEIKSVFTESLGFNLRNETAHGLLNDDESNSIPSFYAWWMTLRIVIYSIMRESPYRQKMFE